MHEDVASSCKFKSFCGVFRYYTRTQFFINYQLQMKPLQQNKQTHNYKLEVDRLILRWVRFVRNTLSASHILILITLSELGSLSAFPFSNMGFVELIVHVVFIFI